MNPIIKSHFINELRLSKTAFAANDLQTAWRHLERAHIIGQNWPVPHTQAHWEMLKFGVRIKSRREVIGQIPRLLFGGIKSFVGRVPTGNTGGSNVPILQKMEIPEDIRGMFVDSP